MRAIFVSTEKNIAHLLIIVENVIIEYCFGIFEDVNSRKRRDMPRMLSMSEYNPIQLHDFRQILFPLSPVDI